MTHLDFSNMRAMADWFLEYGSFADCIADANEEVHELANYVLALLDHVKAQEEEIMAAWGRETDVSNLPLFKDKE